MAKAATAEPVTGRDRNGVLLLVAFAASVAGALYLVPPIAQRADYHLFADARTCLGIPNGLNVLSNLPFTVIGVLGLMALGRPGQLAVDRGLSYAYWVFFIGLALTGPGSIYYHLSPSNPTLVWDRLPIAVAFMGLYAAIIGERISELAGKLLLPVLVAGGIWSVVHWAMTDDLRPYAFVQFFPLVTIPMILYWFRPTWTRGGDLLVAIGCYVAAKAVEEMDRVIYAAGTIVSGHTLKHLAAALGAFVVYRMLVIRQPAPVARG